MSIAEINEFIDWHEGRMEELGYPAMLRLELRRTRVKFWARAMRDALRAEKRG